MGREGGEGWEGGAQWFFFDTQTTVTGLKKNTAYIPGEKAQFERCNAIQCKIEWTTPLPYPTVYSTRLGDEREGAGGAEVALDDLHLVVPRHELLIQKLINSFIRDARVWGGGGHRGQRTRTR